MACEPSHRHSFAKSRQKGSKMMRFSFATMLTRLRKFYGRLMTHNSRLDYCPCLMEGWQHKAAFVIQFRPDTDIEAGRFEGRVEHIAPTKATRFLSHRWRHW